MLIVAIITVGWFYYSSKREKEAAHLFYQSKRLYNSSKNIQNNYKRRLEDQFGTQYSTIIEDVEIEGTLNTHDSVGGFTMLKEHMPKFQ